MTGGTRLGHGAHGGTGVYPAWICSSPPSPRPHVPPENGLFARKDDDGGCSWGQFDRRTSKGDFPHLAALRLESAVVSALYDRGWSPGAVCFSALRSCAGAETAGATCCVRKHACVPRVRRQFPPTTADGKAKEGAIRR